MRNFAILGAKARTMLPSGSLVDQVTLDDVTVSCGIVETAEPEFRKGPDDERRVLVRVKAFSLNYRDKNRVFSMVTNGSAEGFYVIGSEFVAEVLAIGSGVTRFAVGDRVMGNNSYPSSGCDGVLPGVPTNHASKEVQIFHEAKLVKVPDSMPDATAAAFSIGAQTTYSMIRRLEIFDGANVIVTSAKSNTSLFAIQALKHRNVNVYALSTSDRFHTELQRMGVKELVVIDPQCENFAKHPILGQLFGRLGGFHFVIDPYFDLHLSRVIDVMAVGGKYITCGLYDQYLQMIQKQPGPTYRNGRELVSVMLKNLHIMGNCIGLTTDLQAASRDFESGALEVTVDSVFSDGRIAAFLDRTFNAKDRFGKVVYQYN